MARTKDRQTVKRTPKRDAEVGPALEEASAAAAAQRAAKATQGESHRVVLPAGAAATLDDDPAPDSLRPTPSKPEAEPDLGRYELLFELARGGMGTVHVGRLHGAHGFDRLVAIKQLMQGGASEDVEAFLVEARITARVSHPNVVQTLELGEHEGRPFIVMELVQGVSLARLLSRIKRANDRLQPHMVMWIMSRVATGLHAAHELALIHRDVSPENIILSFDGRVYVADFGVAKFTEADKQTKSGVVKGKFAYMSPEQTEASELDRRSDLFALGIVMHESLTGERLFAADSMAATIRRIWAITPPDPRDGRSDIPEALVPVVMRLLEKDRGDRYDTASEVATELRRLLRDDKIMPDEEDLVDTIKHYFPTERATLRQRIEDAIDASGDETSHVAIKSRPLETSPAHHALSTPETTEQGSVTASITTGPPLAQRGYTGAGLALGAALLIGGGLWLSQRPPSVAPQERAAESSATPATDPPSTTEPPPTPSSEPAPSTVASTSPSAIPSATASTSASSTVVDPPSPKGRPRPAPNRPMPEILPKTRPTPAPTRGKPIDIFGD